MDTQLYKWMTTLCNQSINQSIIKVPLSPDRQSNSFHPQPPGLTTWQVDSGMAFRPHLHAQTGPSAVLVIVFLWPWAYNLHKETLYIVAIVNLFIIANDWKQLEYIN